MSWLQMISFYEIKVPLVMAERWDGEYDTAIKIINWVIENDGSAFYCPAELYQDEIYLQAYIDVYDKDHNTQELEKGNWIVLKNDYFTVWDDESFREEHIV